MVRHLRLLVIAALLALALAAAALPVGASNGCGAGAPGAYQSSCTGTPRNCLAAQPDPFLQQQCAAPNADPFVNRFF